jgi:hypothetical protein
LCSFTLQRLFVNYLLTHNVDQVGVGERAKGVTAFRVETGKPLQRIDQFDPTAEQIVMVPRVVGG